MRRLLKPLKKHAPRVSNVLVKSIPVITLVLLAMVAYEMRQINEKVDMLGGMVQQDLMIDYTHFVEFMKRFGGSGQGS